MKINYENMDVSLQIKLIMAQKILEALIENDPVDHLVVEDFLPSYFANELSAEFLAYDSQAWHTYNNTLEDKKTCNQWNLFGPNTYQYFGAICSEDVCAAISQKFGIDIESDIGLHGGGQHIHASMGNLNPHLDYSIYPKTGKERRINAIYYLTDNHAESDGGHFGLWNNKSANAPGELRREYAPTFNRLILFNTSQNSWHGLSRKYEPETGRFRKSLASYYVSNPRSEALAHTRALFAPREEQKQDERVQNLIKLRSSEQTFNEVYTEKSESKG